MQLTVADATEKAAYSEDRSIKLEADHLVAIDQARTELDQAVAVAYATSRDEVSAVIPGLVADAASHTEHAGRRAVLTVLSGAAAVLAQQPIDLVHAVLADALTDDTLPSGTSPLHLENRV